MRAIIVTAEEAARILDLIHSYEMCLFMNGVTLHTTAERLAIEASLESPTKQQLEDKLTEVGAKLSNLQHCGQVAMIPLESLGL